MKVIIVDDEKPIRQWFESILLSIEGVLIVGSFSNGKAALDKCEQEPPDIIFTDIHMPIMNGIDLIRQVRQLYPQTEILILSNYNDFEYVHQGLKLGARDYLLKAQAGDKEIIDFVTKMIEEKETHRECEKGNTADILEYLEKLERYSMNLTDTNVQEYRKVKDKLTQILEKYDKEPSNDSAGFLTDKLIEYIHINYSKQIRLVRLAEDLNYNADYLSQVFKQKTGKNFNAYLIKIRMERAKDLLVQTDKRIKDIAGEVGYINEMYFSTAFKNYTGMSPKSYVIMSKKSG